MDLKDTPLEGAFLSAVEHSMRTMSKRCTRGYSWEAFRIWREKWGNLTFQNRLLLKKFVEDRKLNDDACEAVLQ